MAWKVEYTSTAKAQLRKLDRRAARRIVHLMDERVAAADPRRTGRVLTGPLGNLWRYRVGDYRVICEIRHGAKQVVVLRVKKRDEAYRPR